MTNVFRFSSENKGNAKDTHTHKINCDVTDNLTDLHQTITIIPDNGKAHNHTFSGITTSNDLQNEFSQVLTGKSVPSSTNTIEEQKKNYNDTSFARENNMDTIKFRKVHYIIFLPN